MRATTSDGTTVTARVAIDVRNPDTRAVLEKEPLPEPVQSGFVADNWTGLGVGLL